MKRTRTNSQHQLDVSIKAYLINSINCDYLDIKENALNGDKLKVVYKSFKKEKIDLLDWLEGLCSAVDIYYMDDDILKFADSIGSINLAKACDDEKEMIVNGWFELLAIKLGQLFRAYKVASLK